MLREPAEPLLIDRSPVPDPEEGEIRAWAAEQSVFVSSVISGMDAERQSAADAISSLGARPILFENFGGMDDDPEDAYISHTLRVPTSMGILGSRYGTPLKTGYSATHAEYNEAVRRGLKVSVWNAIDDVDGRQQDFLGEIRVFQTTGTYGSPESLADGVERRLRLAWMPRRRYTNVDPVERTIDGEVTMTEPR